MPAALEIPRLLQQPADLACLCGLPTHGLGPRPGTRHVLYQDVDLRAAFPCTSFVGLRLSRLCCWSQVSALGFVSVFDQVLEGLPQSAQDEIFKSYMSALDEDGPRFRKDATEWEEWAKNLSGTRCSLRVSRGVLQLAAALMPGSNSRSLSSDICCFAPW